ncbi:unnamed protein product [Cylicocyclus nassatus]|uniref:Uncharacterized protein n=1 Tax=Cylicocyclus nassatus TaxID=53992 RepID=A0AA36GMF9_CYLNA|nr:unnamed protein product [Cylicocyclus nassatus]
MEEEERDAQTKIHELPTRRDKQSDDGSRKALRNLGNETAQSTYIEHVIEEEKGVAAEVKEEALKTKNNGDGAAAKLEEGASTVEEEKKVGYAQLGREAKTIQSNQDYVEVLEVKMQDASLSDEVDEVQEQPEMKIMEEPAREEPDEPLIPEEARLPDERLLVLTVELELNQNRQAIRASSEFHYSRAHL